MEIMHKLNTIITASLITVLFNHGEGRATETISVNHTSDTVLFDGKCNDAEWQFATKLALPANTALYLMQNKDALFICAKGKLEDYTVIDLYIEDAQSGELYNLHASAQLSESILKADNWAHPVRWNNKDWGGFWVPFAGTEGTENGERTKFLKGSHREIQILRSKFKGDTWNMMISLSAIYQDGKYGANFSFPDKAVNTNRVTWAKFTF